MARAKAVWKGSKKLQLDPNYPEESDTASGVTVEFLYTGPYQTCRAEKPARGATVADWPTALIVVETKVKKLPGERGQLTVKCVQPTSDLQFSVAGGETATPSEVSWSVDQVEISKRMVDHPRFNTTTWPTRPETWGTATLATTKTISGVVYTLADVVEMWETASDQAGRAEIKKFVTTNFADGTAERLLLNNLISKLARGQDSYVDYAPRVTRKSKYIAGKSPKPGRCGRRLTTEQIAALSTECGGLPENYQWLKAADRATRQIGARFWERDEEWQGADEVDADIYLPA